MDAGVISDYFSSRGAFVTDDFLYFINRSVERFVRENKEAYDSVSTTGSSMASFTD